jgi:virulence factor Mce-like protein
VSALPPSPPLPAPGAEQKRKMFEVVPGRYKPRLARRGAVFLLILGIIVYCAYSQSLPFGGSGGYTVKALFNDAAYLRGNPGATPVRVAGVDVGYVQSYVVAPGGGAALVTMRITDPSVHVHNDASVSIYERTLLGYNMEVDLDPGSPRAPALSGTLPLAQTHSFVDVDQVLQSLNPPGRQGIRAMFGAFSQGFDTPAAGATIDALAPAMRPLVPGLQAFRGTEPGQDLPRLVEETHRLMATTAASEAQLGDMIDSGAVTLGVTAARNADLGAMVQQAPPAMAQTRATMVRLRTTLAALDPLVTRMEPGATELAPAATTARTALVAATPVLRDAQPMLRALNPALSSLGGAGREGSPLLTTLQTGLDNTSSQIIPWLGATDPETRLRNYEAIGPFFSAVDSAASEYDGYGHMVNFQPGGGERSVENSLPCQTFITNPNATQIANCQQLMSLLGQLFGGGGGAPGGGGGGSAVRAAPGTSAPAGRAGAVTGSAGRVSPIARGLAGVLVAVNHLLVGVHR